jgi:hypothetical protein
MADETKWWQGFGNVAQMVAAVGSVGALTFVAWQVSQIEANSRKANARQVYLAYSEAGMRYPEYLRPNYPQIRQDAVKFEQYKWYVTQMILAYDEMIAVADDPVWIKGFDYELPDHIALLCELKAGEPRFFTQFEAKTNAMIDTALKGKCG